MEYFSEMKRPSFRTKCMDIERAGRFARCLTANATRFIEIEIHESKHAKGEARWFVSFLPASEARQNAIVDRLQSAREQRATTQTFTVVADPDHDYHHVYSHTSQETYEVSIAGATCNCPDFRYRANGHFLCKHILATCDAVRTGTVGEFQPIPDRRADQDRFEEIFGDPNTEWMR